MAVNEAAFRRWAELYAAGGDPVANFVRKASHVVDDLVATRAIAPRHVVAAGLSRGGLLAGLLAARNPNVRACLGFAPVTVLADLDEFGDAAVPNERARAKIQSASLLQEDVVEKMVAMPVRFYMGNFDTRVGTRKAFEFVHLLAERAVMHKGMRSPPHEFVMYCRYVFCFLVLFLHMLRAVYGVTYNRVGVVHRSCDLTSLEHVLFS